MNFECQQSCGGKCCTIDWQSDMPGAVFVFLTKEDTARLEKFLGATRHAFSNVGYFDSTRFTREPSKQRYVKSAQHSCTFFKEGKCSVYEARPTQCRTYPYWPENIVDGQLSEEAALACPGVGKGSARHAAHLLVTQHSADKELRERKLGESI